MFYLKINPIREIPIVYLHGYLGHHRNWYGVGKRVGKKIGGYALDLRNHGESPHFNSHSYWDLSEDLLNWLNEKNISKCYLVGHSMGGKAAILASLRYPERIAKMAVLEISPWSKRPPLKIIPRLTSYNLKSAVNIDSVKNDFHNFGFEKEWAQYLSTTIRKNSKGEMSWKLNLPVLEQFEKHILEYQVPVALGNSVPTLFIRAYRSQYLSDLDAQRLKFIYSSVQFRLLPFEGHNPHMEHPELIANILSSFFLKSPSTVLEA